VKVTERAPGLVTLLAPDVDLQFDGEGGVEWAVAKPVNLKDTHGVEITLERLQEMAAAYNPEGIEAAAINFDHTLGGPAHGWVSSLSVRDGLLWVRPVELSAEMVAGIRGGRYRRASVELTTKHPETGGWYLNGLAILGAARPAVKGLPPIRLHAPRFVLDLNDSASAPPSSEEIETAPPDDPGEDKETVMSDPKEKAPAAPGTDDERGLFEKFTAWLKGNQANAAEPPPPPAVQLGLTAEDVKREVATALAGDHVDRDLAALAAEVPPAILGNPRTRASLVAAKLEGAEAYSHQLALVKASGGGASALLGGPTASAETTGEAHAGLMCNAKEQALLAQMGVTPADIARVESKYLKVN